MFDLGRFTLSDTFEVSAAVAQLAKGARDPADAAGRLVRYFYDNALDKESGAPSLAAVQCFVVRPFGTLPAELRDRALDSADGWTPQPGQPCLTLIAAQGDGHARADGRLLPDERVTGLGHPTADKAVPLMARLTAEMQGGRPSPGIVRRLEPGHAIGHLTSRQAEDLPADWRGLFVAYGIKEVLFLTSRLDADRSITLVLYSKVPLPDFSPGPFAAVAVALRLALLEFLHHPLLGPDAAGGTSGAGAPPGPDLVAVENEALRELLRVRHETALEQSGSLETALELAERRATELHQARSALARSEAGVEAILRTAVDAVIVMNSSGRIIEWNPAAEQMFGYDRDEAVGELVADLIVPDDLRSRHSQGLERYLRSGEGPLLGSRVEITGMRRDGTLFPVELTVTAAATDGGQKMFTGFIRDITERREQRAALLASRESFAHIARTLQRSLLPAALPHLPGVDLGAAFHPSRAGSDVGGDFYDVFPLRRDDSMLVLGDVCGKGAEAAAITAIARHTVRAAAADLRHPATVLRRLNSIFLDHDMGERFCSIVAARAVPIVRGLRLSVCCAGHARPFVVRADGRIEKVGVLGQLLGLFPDVRLFEETVQLDRGDTIVLYTDGVTEASRHGEEFGDRRLAELLSRLCGLSAEEMTAGVVDAVLEWGGQQPRDDIAVLAARPVGD